eukprot:gnl/TRDRNA2_/TRDRNA2_59912_c0_seq1.p2 gnl/TRDRNA2_/TRDRNA2_59912_c0~~gnl/TRDRNA2_/TRDRNA2_59912_c0_seq1.p2  ORF type:complete len:119 (+),score=22.21 gnl/TRDRNA2_/TRDRNA2_59912_c0_seq1:66-422(+)
MAAHMLTILITVVLAILCALILQACGGCDEVKITTCIGAEAAINGQDAQDACADANMQDAENMTACCNYLNRIVTCYKGCDCGLDTNESGTDETVKMMMDETRNIGAKFNCTLDEMCA